MSNLNFTPLHYFMNEQVSLIEFCDNKQIVQWVSIRSDEDKLIPRVFTGESSEVVGENSISIRTFNSGELRFQGDFAKLVLDNKAYLVGKLAPADLPQSISLKIEELLK